MLDLIQLIDITALTPLGKFLLVVAVVEAFVIVSLFKARQEDWKRWREESREARKALEDIIARMQDSRSGGGGETTP